MDQALANWVPSGILAGIVILGLKWMAAKVEEKFATLEANDKAHATELQEIKGQMQARISVADHRESTKELHAKINATREELIELRTELRTELRLKREKP
jgi:hypothetical protein